MSARAFSAMQIWSFSRIAGVGNWARSMALVPKAAMWMAVMRDASVSGAAETWRGIWSVVCLYCLLFYYEDHRFIVWAVDGFFFDLFPGPKSNRHCEIV